ncbi:hypothetical protein PHYBLDRAFT_69957 [Phycomyces blakesleeanus NRRL 1555(-)]|uniref:Uncharacterized protein n=1 Tax=Phycomyces blakesleeanus (strain ATCC 8743b / DSM 1359 / FGSC 10004 / NBRC 33097 / NRRL 1555) TaxID=763407 RepID=A0A167M3U1_PHYB8|nr:hypothetical protein PHYBLDRAFT_69957 [Phycomyces blakesleeanus NRRL 1555(-)]OAD71707.1 hypothetical protein PHYBLDRAFT_69957 [Phycomyces blakesleeanus NRRL 1555(-)]|eukprot:XP_018289747.1 hypothetical protein PHYBLDRAFT_69957 [Phycomyces blakesleeanus NRRL 1555(-)]
MRLVFIWYILASKKKPGENRRDRQGSEKAKEKKRQNTVHTVPKLRILKQNAITGDLKSKYIWKFVPIEPGLILDMEVSGDSNGGFILNSDKGPLANPLNACLTAPSSALVYVPFTALYSQHIIHIEYSIISKPLCRRE